MSEPNDYAGDLTASDALPHLERDAAATLVDVRTRAEWNYVGVPDLSGLAKEVVFLEWQRFPEMDVDPAFADTLAAELERRGIGRSSPLFFLCRSGARSRSAARAMTAVGYANCFNLSDGFEGPPDQHGHRNTISGWRACGLPWRQT